LPFEDPDPADTGTDEEDSDPWTDVKTEEELRAGTVGDTGDSDESDTDSAAETTDNDPTDTLPDPSPPDEVADVDVDVWDRTQSLPEEVALLDTSVSCEDCVHRDVCIVYAAIAPQLADEQWDAPGDPPISPEELAIICAAYEPADSDGDAAPAQTIE